MGVARIKLDEKSLRLTVHRIGKIRHGLTRAHRYAVEAAGKVLLENVRFNISSTSRTQRDLDALDNPYARRHGSIRINYGSRGGRIRDGRHIIHRQSGRLLRALEGRLKGVRNDRTRSYEVKVNLALAPHWRYLIEGTRTLLPRDPIMETGMAPAVQVQMRHVMIQEIKRELGKHTQIITAGPVDFMTSSSFTSRFSR